MSHQLRGKISVKCSIDIMRRALIAVMPSWAKHIQVDAGGRIPVYDYNRGITKVVNEKGNPTGITEGFHMMVPSKKNPNYESAPGNDWGDLGFKQNPDKSWEVIGDWGGMGASGLRNPEDLQAKLGAQIAKMKAEAWAKYLGAQTTVEDSEEKTRVVIKVRSRDAAKLKQMVKA